MTITAKESEGRQFVRWKTVSAGVVFENAESRVTTFVMPANDVEITAEMKEAETPGTPEIKPPSEPESQDSVGPDSENNDEADNKNDNKNDNKTDDKLQDKNQEKKKPSDIPKTGDDNKLAETGIMSLISLTVIMLLLFYKRRRNL